MECIHLVTDSFTEVVVRNCSIKKMFLKISQNLQENTCARDSFLRVSGTGVFLLILRDFLEHLFYIKPLVAVSTFSIHLVTHTFSMIYLT